MPALSTCLLAFVAGIASLTAQVRWELQLTVEKDRIILGEPVTAYVVVSNATELPQVLSAPAEAEQGLVSFEIVDPGGGSVRYMPVLAKDGPFDARTVPAGGNVHWPCRIFFGSGGWTFRTVGRHTVRARMAGLSASVALDVLPPPDPAVLRQAEALVANYEAGKLLYFGGGEHLKQGRAVLEQIAEGAPRSLLSAHASLALGTRLATAAPDFDRRQMRPPDLAAAERLLGTALAHPDLGTDARLKALRLVLTIQRARSSPAARQTDQALRQLEMERTKRHGVSWLEPSARAR